MNKNGILFDLDGTLWNSCDTIIPSWQKVITAKGIDRPPLTKEEMATYMGKTVEQIAPLMLPMLSIDEGVAVILEGCNEECFELRKNGAVLYDGIIQVLCELSKSYRLFIVSNCQDGYIQTFIEHYKLDGVIEDFEMAGRTGLCKGDNIRLVMERNGIDKAFYVGDTEMDMEAAHKAQIPFAFAAYGFGQADSPEFTVNSPRDILKTARDFFSK